MTGEIDGFDPDYHYVVHGCRTSSRNQALTWAGGDLTKIHFYCLDHVWDKADWGKEPQRDINEMILSRCHQLRDQYDWLCLWLSGGYDSQTILQSFVESKVVLDEIAYMDRQDYYDDPELPFILQAIRKYKQYHNPNLRILHVPTGYHYTADLYKKLKEQWIFQPGCSLRPSKSSAPFVQRFHDLVVQRQTSTRRRRADIYGKEKPRLDLYQNKWYMCVPDSAMHDTTGAGIVEFYTTQHMPELHIKQCYLAIKFFETIPECCNDLVHKIQSHDQQYYKLYNLALGRRPILGHVSQHGINKFHFAQSINSPDSHWLLHHLSRDQHTLVGMIKSTLTSLAADVKSDCLDQTILSKKWYICNFKSQSAAQRSLVDQQILMH